jgi:hypothetical protein
MSDSALVVPEVSDIRRHSGLEIEYKNSSEFQQISPSYTPHLFTQICAAIDSTWCTRVLLGFVHLLTPKFVRVNIKYTMCGHEVPQVSIFSLI